MEARRYRSHDKPANITVSSRTLPGIIVICIGLLITIAGIVLMAAFKLDDITQNTKQMVGPIVLGVGIIVTLVGLFYSSHLRKKRDQEMARIKLESRRRQEEEQKEQQYQQQQYQQQQYQQQMYQQQQYQQQSPGLPQGRGNPPVFKISRDPRQLPKVA